MQLSEEVNQELAQAMKDGKHVVLDLQIYEAFVLLAFLKLVFRHPQASQMDIAKMVRAITAQVQKQLPQGGAIATVAQMGWEERFDG